MAHVLAKDLRDAVIQAAMSGKLTCYEDGDTNIDTYIEDLVKNKEKNVKSKKWKKEFSVEHIDNSSFEYSLANNWKWCYLGDICAIRGGKRVPVGRKLSEEPTSQKYIRVADMKNHSIISNTIKYLPDDLIEKLALYTISKNDLYITVAGTIGDVGVVPNELDGANLTENADKIIFENIDKQWLMTCLLSNVVQRQINEATTQVGQPKLAIKRIQSLSIPLCPLEEQKRIVSKVNELMAKIDEYEKLENQLVQLKEQFPKDMRDSLLQAGMMGKLTKQLKNDTSVEEILKSIEEQKKTLIKEDKLQKKKSFHLIRNDEIPFDIPDNWVFAKLGYISTYDEAKQKINARDANDNLWMLDLEDIAKGGTLLCKKRVFERKAIGDKTIFEKGSILYSKLRPYLLKILIADEDGICTPELVPFKMYGGINTSYIALFLKSPYVDSEINKVTYGVKMPRVGTKTMVNFYVPLPPIEEQQRIVDKLDEMLPLVDALAQMD